MNYEIIMYTDGASSPHKTKNGGWSVVIILPKSDASILTLSGACKNTTNNRMEIMGVLKGLTLLQTIFNKGLDICRVVVYSDSMYVIKGLTEWRTKWEADNFNTIKNEDLWRKLYAISDTINYSIFHVKGHSGDYYNTEADRLATQALAYLEGRVNA